MFSNSKESDTNKELNLNPCALNDDELEKVSGGWEGTVCHAARSCGGIRREGVCQDWAICPYRDWK